MPPAAPDASVPSRPRKLDLRRLENAAPKRRIELRLTPNEYAVLEQIVDERECSIQWWVVSLVRAALTRGVTVGGAELKALGESNYQLTVIARGLNQISKQLSADPRQGQAMKVEHIRALTQQIEANRRATHAVVHASSHRWVIKEDGR